jgi:hypothetical protein
MYEVDCHVLQKPLNFTLSTVLGASYLSRLAATLILSQQLAGHQIIEMKAVYRNFLNIYENAGNTGSHNTPTQSSF